MQKQAARSTRRLLHSLNLPAGTDVSRLLAEIGELKKQVRQLSQQLEKATAEARTAQTRTPKASSSSRSPAPAGGAAKKKATRNGAARA